MIATMAYDEDLAHRIREPVASEDGVRDRVARALPARGKK
jgi:hypothetical protein